LVLSTLFFIYFHIVIIFFYFFFSSRRRHTRLQGDWSSDVCSSDLQWFSMTLAGPQPLDPDAPVSHVGFIETDVRHRRIRIERLRAGERHGEPLAIAFFPVERRRPEIGRASCRERGQTWGGVRRQEL